MKLFQSSFWLSVASTSIVLTLLGVFAITSFHTRSISTTLKKNIDIIVELRKDVESTEIEELKNEITGFEEYITGSLKIYNEEDALNMMKKEINEVRVFDSLLNPFNPVLSFNINDQYHYAERLERIVNRIKRDTSVIDVNYQQVAFDEIESNFSKVSFYFFLLALLFVLITIFLLHTNFQILLTNDRKKIKTMQLVGAHNKFVIIPYVRKAFFIGLSAFFISVILLFGLIWFLYNQVALVADVLVPTYLLVIALLLLLIALSIPMVSTYIIISLYLTNNSN